MTRRKSIIEVDRQKYEAKYIGKGQYSKAYRVGDRVVLYTKGDCAKEALSMFQYDRMAHLPELIQHDFIRGGQYGRGDLLWYVFSTPYYRNVTRKDTSAWNLMKCIIEYWNEYWKSEQDYQYQAYGRVHVNAKVMQKFVEFLKVNEIRRSIIRALQELVDISRNCGNEVGFDFKKSNFGVNEYGTLIFRDVIWVFDK